MSYTPLKKKFKTSFGLVDIVDMYREDEGEWVRLLLVDRAQESASYVEEEKRNELYFKYMRALSNSLEYFVKEAKERNDDIKDILLIGGGGFSFPKYVMSHYESLNMDVVELYEEMLDYALDYFYLKDLIEDYGLIKHKRLNIIIGDAVKFISRPGKKYDIIINDAFHGETPNQDMLTPRAVENIKAHLSANGVYMINLITGIEGYHSMAGIVTEKVLERFFKCVRSFPVLPCRDKKDKQNVIYIATDNEAKVNGTDFEKEFYKCIKQRQTI